MNSPTPLTLISRCCCVVQSCLLRHWTATTLRSSRGRRGGPEEATAAPLWADAATTMAAAAGEAVGEDSSTMDQVIRDHARIGQTAEGSILIRPRVGTGTMAGEIHIKPRHLHGNLRRPVIQASGSVRPRLRPRPVSMGREVVPLATVMVRVIRITATDTTSTGRPSSHRLQVLIRGSNNMVRLPVRMVTTILVRTAMIRDVEGIEVPGTTGSRQGHKNEMMYRYL